jgi:hypothetical protein
VPRWPITQERYAWDLTNAPQDREVAEALERTFPRDLVVGQSDYLRLGLWTDHPFLDLSGLVNASLAHRPHPPYAVVLADARTLLEFHPDLYFWTSPWIVPENHARYRLSDEEAAEAFYALPSSPADLRALEQAYAIGSIRLSDGRYLHLLVARSAVPRMKTRDYVDVEPETPGSPAFARLGQPGEGFALDGPRWLQPEPDAVEAGGARRWVARDGRATLTVALQPLQAGQDLEGAYRQWSVDAPERGYRIEQRLRGDDWFALTGQEGGLAFQRMWLFGAGRVGTYALQFPPEQAEVYRLVLPRMVSSFGLASAASSAAR